MSTSDMIVLITDQSGIIQEIHSDHDPMAGLEPGTCLPELRVIHNHKEGWIRIKDQTYRYQIFDLSYQPGYLYILFRDKLNYETDQGDRHRPLLNNSMIDNIIGSSPVISSLRKTLLMIAASPSSVLITGESGTGKELFAQAIHYCGERAQNRFVKVNCAAIPESLLESELFGYVEGAFTGARKGGRTGKFELANQGTIFLDEIGDMALSMQAKLLRVLQEREIEKIGDDHPTPVDVRIISATNKDLPALVSQGLFRLDLYYRLNVLHLHIPSLSERQEDIPLLAEFFMKQLNEKLGLQVRGIDSRAMNLLMRYNWPGNIRELNNVIETAMNFCRSTIITPEDLPAYIRHLQPSAVHSVGTSLKTGLIATEYRQILNALKVSRGNRQKAAKILGISRTTLYRLMKKHQLIQ